MPELMEQVWSPDTCGCVVRETWWRYFCTDCSVYYNPDTGWCNYWNKAVGSRDNCEHNSDEPARVHALKSFDHKCEYHNMLNDAACYAQVKRDNFKKNDAVTEFLEYMGYEGRYNEFKETYLDTSTYSEGWYYTVENDMRVCHFVMKNMTQGQKVALQTQLDNRIGEGEVILD